MDIIVVSNRFTQARSFAVSGPQVAFLILLFSLLVVSLAVLLNYFSLRYAVTNQSPYLRSLLEAVQAEQSRHTQSYLRESLNTMAARLGEMQAKLLRLDSLGDRLTKLAGLNPKEFMFDKPPARGGPVPSGEAQELSMVDLVQQMEVLAQQLDDRSDKLGVLESHLTFAYAKKQLLPTQLPVSTGWFSSNFGWRIDPFTGLNAFHEGMDFMAPEGTPVTAAAGGVVVYAGEHPQYGNMLEIDHGNGLVTRYAHASRLEVRIGDVVLRGQKIAEVGNTGRSTGAHLHFEVRQWGAPQNPARFLQVRG
ncbi:MAG TPA: M23 family metallopeptidase [Burkholderiales bacterium]|jgi:murein DD-endopeptidase MepM/ murein hydrolase activator NlpD|nr:M23 family metallopeptidase [Burkholderiales bacterium]